MGNKNATNNNNNNPTTKDKTTTNNFRSLTPLQDGESTALHFENKLDSRRPQSRSISELSNAQISAHGWGSPNVPAYMLVPVDESVPLDDTRLERVMSETKSNRLSSRGGGGGANGGGGGGTGSIDSEGSAEEALVYIMHSPLPSSKRISKRESKLDVKSAHPVSIKTEELSFSMVNAAAKSSLPSFVESLDGAIMGRQIKGNEHRGQTGRLLCQDEIDFDATDKDVLLGVFDGHGPDGHAASALCAAELRAAIRDEQEWQFQQSNFKDALTDGIKALSRRLDEMPPHRLDLDESGTTATICLINANMLYVVNIGDSRAVGALRIHHASPHAADLSLPKGTFQVVDLSKDHVLTVKEEIDRVVQWGGVVEPLMSGNQPIGPPRAWFADRSGPGIMVSRSLGDRKAKTIGVTAEPTITMFNTNEFAFVIVATDGLWEVLTSEEATGIVGAALMKRKELSTPINLSETLLLEAQRRWLKLEGGIMDDLSAVVINFVNI
jgi:serine/threonine protein phosphatase PrpC